MRRGEIKTKLDVTFLSPYTRSRLERLHKSPFPVTTFSSLVAMENGIRYGTGSPPPILKAAEDTVAFVRATDIKNGEIRKTGLLHIARDQPERLQKCRLTAGEIILVRSGVNTGDCAVVPLELEGAYAAYDLIIRLNAKALPNFVAEFLDTPIGRTQLNLVKARAAQPHINAAEFGAVTVPLPPLDIQRSLVAEMETARESRRAKFNEAEVLLKSLDGWLLAQLGVTIPPKGTHIVFAARLGEARRRVDAAFHSPRFRAIREGLEHGNYPARAVGLFCISIKSGFAAGKQDQAENNVDGVPHLRPLNLSIYGDLSLKGTKYVPRTSLTAHDFCQQGEVLFNNTNSEELVGKSTVFDLDVDCACSNHMTRLELTPDASPYFIAALFNALRSTGYLGMLATNFVNQAGINTETLSALRIPFPALNIQQTILSEVSQRRAEAHRLRAEAEAEWQAAKERFEHQLLAGK